MPRKSRSPATDAGAMSIGALSRATGVAVETLRTWERRYGVPLPVRKPSGHRLYPTSAVEQLRLVEQLLNRGHRPAEVLPLAPPELEALLALSEGRSAASRAPAKRGAPAPGEAGTASAAVAELLAATREFDPDRLVRELRANWTRLGPLRFLEECATPFMGAIGDSWAEGEMNIRHEHFASACLADFLREVRGPHAERADGPVVAAATLEGDLHEGGLLMASVLLAVHGWRVIYLGANTPVAEIAELARQQTLHAVALSISAAVPKARATRALRSLRAKLPRRVALWVGGAGAPPATRGVERLETLTELDARLARPA